MKPTMLPRSIAEIAGAPGVARHLGAGFQQLASMLGNGLTISDNMAAAFVEVSATHGTEALWQNPLSTPVPRAVIPLYSDAQKIDAWKWRAIDTATRTMGLTVEYALDHHSTHSFYRNNANQSINYNTETQVTLDTAVSTRGSGVTFASSTWTIVEPGDYYVAWQVTYEHDNTGSRRGWIVKNATPATKYAHNEASATMTTTSNWVTVCGSSVMPALVAGDTLKLYTAQYDSDGGGTAHNVLSGSTLNTYAQVTKIRASDTPTDTVHLLVLGG